MKILLYTLNYAPELTGIGKYSGELCEWLALRGHEVRVVCAPPYYPEWAVREGYSGSGYRVEVMNGVKVFRSPLFVPKQPSMLTRLLHLCSFAVTSLPAVLAQLRWQPHVIVTVEPTFFCVPGAMLLSWMTGAKSLLHIQDFELDAMLCLGLVQSRRLRRSGLRWVEAFFMRRFHAISSISYSMLNRARYKAAKSMPMYFFPNWVDTDFIRPGSNAAELRRRWRLSEHVQVVLYSGNLGKKQGLDMVLSAAKRLAANPDVIFLILGEGAEKRNLMAMATHMGLHNVRFESLVPYQYMPSLMALGDVHLVIQKKGVSTAVLPSKLTTILSAGGYALITAEAGTELGLLCEHYPSIAERVEPEDLDQFVAALDNMLVAARLGRSKINEVARNYALEYLNKEKVLRQFEAFLVDLV